MTSAYEEHLHDLPTLFARFKKLFASSNFKKCRIYVPQVEYLSYGTNKKGISPNVDKLVAVLQPPMPQNLKELHRLSVLVNSCRRFLPFGSSLLLPLELLPCNRKYSGNRTSNCLQASGNIGSSYREL